MEGRRLIFVHVIALEGFVSFLELSRTLGSLAAHGLGKVPVDTGIREVDFFRVIVGQNPREDGILRQVVVRSSSEGV